MALPQKVGLARDLHFIHTWLQPGDMEGEIRRKPFKRFPIEGQRLITWLKPGVTKKRKTTLGIAKIASLAPGTCVVCALQ